MSHSVRYDWRDPCDDVTSAGTAAFGLIHCLANDTSAAVAASGESTYSFLEISCVLSELDVWAERRVVGGGGVTGRCEQTTPSVDAMGLTKNWSAHPKLSYVAMRTLHQQLINGETTAGHSIKRTALAVHALCLPLIILIKCDWPPICYVYKVATCVTLSRYSILYVRIAL